MSRRFTALVIGLLFAGSSVVGAQAPRTIAQTPPPAGTLRGRAQVQTPLQRMPNLVGMPFQSAQEDSRVTGLKLQLDGVRRPTKDQRPGVIVDQEPAPGSVIKPGMRVTVYVAVPPPQQPPPPPVVRMPNLVGQPFQSAQEDSRVVRLKLQLVPQPQPTANERPGVILRHDPPAESPVKPGTPVTVMVAVPIQQPPPPPQPVVRMPDLVGQPFQSAQEDSRVVRLKLQLVPQPQPTANDRPGVILRHDPPAESPVKPGTPVTVIVAVAPTPVLYPMPDLVGHAFPAAERDAAVLRLRLQLNQQLDSRAGGAPNTIVRQSVPAGASVQIGDAVTVFVASGVAVPRVVQSQADAAMERIVAVGLTPRRSDETSEATPGMVLRQVPEPGVLVARGGAVAITVAVPPKVTIPNVVGRTRADAVQELTRLRLRPSPTDDAASALPPEQVVSQVPGAGTEVVVGAAVRIGVATGVEVPNLSGLSAADAQRAAAERGLSFEDTDQESDAAAPGQVFQQQPQSGTRVTRGSRVLATVAIPVRVLVPNVVGMTRQRAAVVLEAAGLRTDPEPDAAALNRLIVRQQPIANDRVVRLTSVALLLAAPPPPPVTPPPGAAQPLPPGPELTPPPGVQVAPPAAGPGIQPGVVEPAVAQPGIGQPGVVQPPAQNSGAQNSGAQNGGAQNNGAQNSGGTPAVPVAVTVQPLLPPWLLSLLVAIAAIGVSTFRLWWPNRPPPAPPIQASVPATAPPAVDVRPERGDSTLRLEVSGRSLISMDVRVRVERGSVEQTLSLAEPPFIVEERRLYE